MSQLSLILAAVQVVVPHEPIPAEPWEQSLLLQCHEQILRIEGYGAAKPFDRPVAVTLNGQALSGPGAEVLIHDLGNRRAVYRLVGLCSQVDDEMSLLIYRGVRDVTGEVVYSGGTASFLNGRLRRYSGLTDSNADTFWFR